MVREIPSHPAAHGDRLGTAAAPPRPDAAAHWLREGIIAGLLGAGATAIFFFVVDLLAGRPLYTPTLLGSVILRGADPEAVSGLQPGVVALFGVVHVIFFALLGIASAYTFAQLESRPAWGWFVFLVFVCLVAWLAGLLGGVVLLTGSELGSLTLAASVLLATLVMAAWLWRHHPRAMRTLAWLRDVRDPSSRRGD